MSSPSVEAVAGSGGNRLTSASRTVATVVGKIATWKVYCI